MKVYKELELKNPLYVAKLCNGVTLNVFDGYAEGSDGEIYLPVVNESDSETEFIGWRKAQ